MLTSKTFVKKTRSGNVVRVVREHYLRDDLTCGSSMCTICPNSNTCLEAEPSSVSDLCSDPHYLIPDTNVIIHQIDVLCEPVFKNVIVLQTVIEEIKHRRSPACNKLREVLSNSERHFYVFINEHHRDTYVERQPGETINDRNDRAIRHAAKWYDQHLENIKVVLLTNDRDNSEKANAEGIPCYTFAEYVESMKDHPSLVDKLAQTTKAKNDGEEFIGKPRNIYSEHWKLSKIQEGLKAGTLYQGKFQASRENYLEGYVFVGGEDESESSSIFIQGRKNLNRVIHGDNVAVQILPEEEWSCPSSLVFEDRHVDIDEDDDEIFIQGRKNLNRVIHGDNVAVQILPEEEWSCPSSLVLEDRHVDIDEDDDEETILEKKRAANRVRSGAVVGIIKKNWRPYCGTVQPLTIKGAGIYYLFVPSERRIPKIRIQTRQGNVLLSKRIIVSIDSWPRDSKYPQGHYVQTVGEIGEKETENQVLLLEHDIPHQPFSKAVLDCLPVLPWIITDAGFELKVDSNKALAESLEKAVVPENPYFNVMLRMVATRCMAQALYFSSGVLPQTDYYHYGLAVPIYTHFTSPIRRYSDVIVHRLLAVAVGADVTYPALVDKKKTQELCNNLNYRHKQAQYCGRASVNLYTHIFFKDRVVEEEGYILFIRENALQILLPCFGLECTLYLSSLNKENDAVSFEYDEKEPSQSANGVILRQFDPVTVQLHIDRSNVQHQKTVLKLVKPYIPNFSVSPLSEEPPTKKTKF